MDTQRFRVRLQDGREFGPAEIEVIAHWAAEGRVPRTAALVPEGGGDAKSVLEEPRLAAIVSAPPTAGRAAAPAAGDEGVSKLIPYRNKPALIGYYLAIFGCLFAIFLPVLGFAMPIAAIVLGVKGWKAAKANPKVHGKAHAFIAVAGGCFGTLLAVGNLLVFLLIAARP